MADRNTPTSSWTEDELRIIGDSQELQLASTRLDGTLRSSVTMWVARVGDSLYVRSACGPRRTWYPRACAAVAGASVPAAAERNVTFASASPDVQEAIVAAYQAKYDRYGPRLVGSVTGPGAHDVTIRLEPRTRQEQR